MSFCIHMTRRSKLMVFPIVVLIYLVSTYLLYGDPSLTLFGSNSKFTAMDLNGPRQVHGFGTIGVNVQTLGRMSPHYLKRKVVLSDEVRFGKNILNFQNLTLKSLYDRGKPNSCFELYFNYSRDICYVSDDNTNKFACDSVNPSTTESVDHAREKDKPKCDKYITLHDAFGRTGGKDKPKCDKYITLHDAFGRTGEKDKPKCDKYITLHDAFGRTGNQMFQVAALLGIAFKQNLIPVINSSFPLTRWFELPNLSDIEVKDARVFKPKASAIYEENIDLYNITTNVTLYGYFQSWRYFEEVKQLIRKAFTIKDKYLTEAKWFIGNVSKFGRDNVCLHYRRGDMNTEETIQRGYTIADMSFINNSMNYYRNNFNSVQFIILSDGIFWCKDNIKGEDVIYSPLLELASDMALMTLCDHVIVTSGTFGWWGAWLARGTTVYYAGYPEIGSWLSFRTNRSDYYPPNWIGMT